MISFLIVFETISFHPLKKKTEFKKTQIHFGFGVNFKIEMTDRKEGKNSYIGQKILIQLFVIRFFFVFGWRSW
jgi:hypothetical protein